VVPVIINDCIILVVIVFFGLVIHSILKDEKRKSARRQQQLANPIERRLEDRRRKSIVSYLAWAIRSRWSKFTK